jgi:hypothetical protein
MKYLFILLVSSCATLSSKNISTVQIGDSEKQIRDSYRVVSIRDSGKYKVIALDDGFLVTDHNNVLHKTEIQHPYDSSSEVKAISLTQGQKFKYFVKADPRTVDPKSILFQSVRRQIEAMLALHGEAFVKDEKDATANLYVSYAVTGQLTRTLSQGVWVLSEETKYTRFLLLTAVGGDKSQTNLWETKVESLGPNNDMSIILPGHIAAAGKFINKITTGAEKVEVPGTSIIVNIIKNPNAFSPYLDQELAANN